MRAIGIILAALCFATAAQGQGDAGVASAQRVLKDQGFYYGEVTGQKDADTTAAIRRYQIRNGLQITGDLNVETQKSLRIKTTAPPPSQATPRAPASRPAPPETSDLRDDSSRGLVPPSPGGQSSRPLSPQPRYAPSPNSPTPETNGVLNATPYEAAPPNVQRRVIAGAQTLLARRGYYRGEIDGVFGPDLDFALRAYQSRFAMAPNGRLDVVTLGAMGLLPGQEAPGLTARGRRNLRRPPIVTPGDAPVYIPR